jgi:hypothetical protein
VLSPAGGGEADATASAATQQAIRRGIAEPIAGARMREGRPTSPAVGAPGPAALVDNRFSPLVINSPASLPGLDYA